MDPKRLPLCHVLRQKHKDDRLWVRRKGKALLYNLDKMHCLIQSVQEALCGHYGMSRSTYWEMVIM